jgi:hypothetical protein
MSGGRRAQAGQNGTKRDKIGQVGVSRLCQRVVSLTHFVLPYILTKSIYRHRMSKSSALLLNRTDFNSRSTARYFKSLAAGSDDSHAADFFARNHKLNTNSEC